MYKEKVKVTWIKDSDVDYFVRKLAERYFMYQGHGSMSAAIRYVIEYGLSRESKDKMLTMSWTDLPQVRINEWDKVMHGVETVSYTTYVPIDFKDRLDYMAKSKTREENKMKEMVDVWRFPKFSGLRRNVIVQCVRVLIDDMAEMCMNGETVEKLRDVEKYYGVVVKRSDEE